MPRLRSGGSGQLRQALEGRGLRLQQLDGVAADDRPGARQPVRRYAERPRDAPSPAAVEALAVVAYQQP